MKLYSYWRSSASYRVRIALQIKELFANCIYVNLLKGEQFNHNLPNNRVPALLHNGLMISQSTAIIEYIEEVFPDKTPLLPKNTHDRAQVRSFCQLIACDIHPVNNLAVLAFLKDKFNISDIQKKIWYENWIISSFESLEKVIERDYPLFCFGHSLTMAECYLIPQIYNALRFNVNLENYPKLMNIYNNCMKLEAFVLASPERQKDSTV